MFSKILVKLIDQAIVPAIVLLAVRVISVVGLSYYHDADFSLSASGFIFGSAQDYVLINSQATFAMVVVLTVGLLYILVKSYIFHESHIKPHITARMFSLRLSSFIQSTFDLYSQGAIWLSYSYLIMIVSGVMAAFGFMYAWVFYVSFVLCLLSTVLLVLDVEHELAGTRLGEADFDTDTEFVDPEEKKYA